MNEYFLFPDWAEKVAIVTALSILITTLLRIVRFKKLKPRLFPLSLLRIACLMCLGFAYAGPYKTRTLPQETVPVMFDISKSVDLSAGNSFIESLKALSNQGLSLSIFPFASRMSTLGIRADDLTDFSALQKAYAGLDLEQTNLAEAYQSLQRMYKPRQIVLASDGFETRGDIREVLGKQLEQGAALHPIFPTTGASIQGSVRIAMVHAPLKTQQQSTVPVRVTLENSGSADAVVILEVLQGESSLMRKAVRVPKLSEQVVLAQSLPMQGGISEFKAQLITQKTEEPFSIRRAFTTSDSRERIALLSGSLDDSRYLKQVLENQAYQIESRVGSSASSIDNFSGFSAVVLNNISYDQLGAAAAQRLINAVKSGTGLIMVGGERSFGNGGYRGTPLEQALPVELLAPERKEKRLNLAVMLVIDKSRSMDSDNKMDYAKEAARTFITSLKDEDYVGVIAFDASPFIVVRLGLLSEIREMARDRIGRIFPTGSTQPLTAIDEARRSLLRVAAGRKHMLFLTDGQIENAGPHYLELIKQMHLMGITSSMVMLGPEGDGGFLRSLADRGGGTYYQTNDPRALPRIFLNDVKVLSNEPAAAKDRLYTAKITNPSDTLSQGGPFPTLSGIVDTALKPNAHGALSAQSEENTRPLVAHWRYGSGTVVAFTSDANGRWSSQWVSWDGFHSYWNRLLTFIRSEAAQAPGERITADLNYYVKGGELIAEYSTYDDSTKLSEVQYLISGQKQGSATLEQVKPGLYRGSLGPAKSGRYDITGVAGNQRTLTHAFELDESLFTEQTGRGLNQAHLSAIARLSGGMLNPSTSLLAYGLDTATEKVDLSSWLIALALIIALLEILLRELPQRSRSISHKSYLLNA
jgi:Ca-activated chloride channel family protein